MTPKEADALSRILTRREQIAEEMADIICQLYPEGKFYPIITEKASNWEQNQFLNNNMKEVQLNHE